MIQLSKDEIEKCAGISKVGTKWKFMDVIDFERFARAVESALRKKQAAKIKGMKSCDPLCDWNKAANEIIKALGLEDE